MTLQDFAYYLILNNLYMVQMYVEVVYPVLSRLGF
jgi:hypothetical protein